MFQNKASDVTSQDCGETIQYYSDDESCEYTTTEDYPEFTPPVSYFVYTFIHHEGRINTMKRTDKRTTVTKRPYSRIDCAKDHSLDNILSILISSTDLFDLYFLYLQVKQFLFNFLKSCLFLVLLL